MRVIDLIDELEQQDADELIQIRIGDQIGGTYYTPNVIGSYSVENQDGSSYRVVTIGTDEVLPLVE